VDALVAFAAALLSFRLAGLLAARWRTARRPELLAWSAGLGAYAVAAAAIAWGEAHGWDGRAFRVYYAAGALLTAPLLGFGSLLLAGWRKAAPIALVYTGLAIGIAVAMPLHGSFATSGIPHAQDHLAFLPARLLAILANSLGTIAVVGVALRSISKRPVGNALIIAGIVAAAIGSGLAGLGAAGSAIGIAVGAVLLYAGFVYPMGFSGVFRPGISVKSP
jgi:stage V sporulation protein SpoVS